MSHDYKKEIEETKELIEKLEETKDQKFQTQSKASDIFSKIKLSSRQNHF